MRTPLCCQAVLSIAIFALCFFSTNDLHSQTPCPTGTKIIIPPVNSVSGNPLYFQAEGYGSRTIHYPEPAYNSAWNFPQYLVGANDTIVFSSAYQYATIEMFGIESPDSLCPVVITTDNGILRIDKGIKMVDVININSTVSWMCRTAIPYP
jgi:hypothetical protein